MGHKLPSKELTKKLQDRLIRHEAETAGLKPPPRPLKEAPSLPATKAPPKPLKEAPSGRGPAR